jgi:predicted nuclease of restriction endonuclease-like (RecB) superfamily
VSGKSRTVPLFPLSWSHFVRLPSIKNDAARQFNEKEALRGGWSFRQLERQIATQFYERAKRSQRKLTARGRPEDALTD